VQWSLAPEAIGRMVLLGQALALVVPVNISDQLRAAMSLDVIRITPGNMQGEPCAILHIDGRPALAIAAALIEPNVLGPGWDHDVELPPES
jgi:hypothetical protein